MNVVIRGEVPGRCQVPFGEVGHPSELAAWCDPNRSCARVWAGLALIWNRFMEEQAGDSVDMASADGVLPRKREDDARAELDLRLQDPAALEEIELYSELIIVAGESSRPLSRDEIDRVLGVTRPQAIS